jgi:molybdate transport system ATP-binding protein
MDEPLSSLDAARREEIMRVIERIRDELALPILYVSHDRAEVERLATTIVPL